MVAASPMRVVVLTFALVLALPTAGPAAVPKAAQKWLGTWSTNFGHLFVYDIYRAKSETVDVNGNPQRFWKFEATWIYRDDDNGADRRFIEGGVVGQNFDQLGGCWTPSPEPTNCARILINRSGEKITGGYWKNCRDYCKSHHPFKGF